LEVYDDNDYNACLAPYPWLGLLRRDRFLCITRAPSQTGHPTPVLEDIFLINEYDTSPSNYRALWLTIDKKEKATGKRIICVKMTGHESGKNCICDIIFLNCLEKLPESYTYIGEINGLKMCIQRGHISPLTET
jgi:hypothetical protein